MQDEYLTRCVVDPASRKFFLYSSEGEERVGIFEERWLKYQDKNLGGTKWVNATGVEVTKVKSDWVEIANINSSNYFNLLPEYHLRPYDPKFISQNEFIKEVDSIESSLKELFE